MSHDTRYEIILYWSDEDQAIIAEVPELPGCAADGATYQEALANVQTISRNGSRRPRNWGELSPTQGPAHVRLAGLLGPEVLPSVRYSYRQE